MFIFVILIKLTLVFKHWVSCSPKGRGPGTSLGFLGKNFVPSSDIGLGSSGQPGLRTSDATSYFFALACLIFRMCLNSFFELIN